MFLYNKYFKVWIKILNFAIPISYFLEFVYKHNKFSNNNRSKQKFRTDLKCTELSVLDNVYIVALYLFLKECVLKFTQLKYWSKF